MHQEMVEEYNQTAAIRNMLAGSGYSDKAISYYIHQDYMGVLTDADQNSELIGSCGDTMKVSLKVEDGIIKDIRYQVMGCPGAVASAMAAANLIKGKKLQEARILNDSDIFIELEDIPAKKHHCIQLAVKALHQAIDDYRSKH